MMKMLFFVLILVCLRTETSQIANDTEDPTSDETTRAADASGAPVVASQRLTLQTATTSSEETRSDIPGTTQPTESVDESNNPEPIFETQTALDNQNYHEYQDYQEYSSSVVQPMFDEDDEPPLQHLERFFQRFEYQVLGLHAELCGTSCGFSFPLSRSPRAPGCAACYCDHLCVIYQDCCPDLQVLESMDQRNASQEHDQSSEHDQELFREVNEKESNFRLQETDTCVATIVRPDLQHRTEHQYVRMVNFCPKLNASDQGNEDGDSPSVAQPHVNNSTNISRRMIEDKCKNLDGSVHWDYVRPVSSASGIVYRNRFCAQCHHVNSDNITAWVTSVECDPQLLLSAKSVEDAYFTAAATPTCDVVFDNDGSGLTRKCSAISRPVISSCNQTGLWKQYDERVDQACAMFTSVVLRKYKNVFCALCNVAYGYSRLETTLGQKVGDEANPSIFGFYALLQFDGDDDDDVMSAPESAREDTTDDRCDPGSLRDPVNCQCREVLCGSGMHLKGGNCTEIYTRSNYFGLQACARFLFAYGTAVSRQQYGDFMGLLVAWLQSKLYVRRATGMPFVDCHDNTTLTVDVEMKVYSGQALALTDLAQTLIETLKTLAGTLEANAIVLSAQQCLSDRSQYEGSFSQDCPSQNLSLSLGVVSLAGHGLDIEYDDLGFLSLYNTSFCPHVNVTEQEFFKLTSMLTEINYTIDDVTFDYVMDSGQASYLVCADNLFQTFNNETCMVRKTTNSLPNHTSRNAIQTRGPDADWSPLGLTSTLCTCVSLLSLSAVIVSYMILSPLRAGAGLSTMAMAATLFVAQALHEFAIEQYEIQELCTVFAILIHFFWLASVMMMSVTTAHFFLAVVFPLRARTAFASRKVIWFSLAFALISSAALVGLTMLGNFFVHGDIGYPGDFICFIRRPRSRQLGFGLPLAIAVTFNLVLFLCTSVHIRRRPTLNSTCHERVSLSACFRLSVITGASWLSLFLLAIPGTRPWLEYACVVLVGLQGCMLAATLLATKRVMRLWQGCVQSVKTNGGSGSHRTRSTPPKRG